MRRIKVLPFKAGLLDLQMEYFNKMAKKGQYFYKKEGIFYYFKEEKVCDYYTYTTDYNQAKAHQIIASKKNTYYLGINDDQQLDNDYHQLTNNQANKSVKVYWLFIFLSLSPMIISYMLMLMSDTLIVSSIGALLQMFGIVYYVLMVPYLVNMVRNLLIMMKKGDMETPFTQRYQLVIDNVDQMDIHAFKEFKNWKMSMNEHRVLASFVSEKNAETLKQYIASKLNIDQKQIHITGATDYFIASLAV